MKRPPFFCVMRNVAVLPPHCDTMFGQCGYCEAYQEGRLKPQEKLPAVVYEADFFYTTLWLFKLWDGDWQVVTVWREK